MKERMICTGVLVVLLIAASAHASVPSLMSYQGKLTNEHGAPVPNDDYEMRFCIYSDSTGGDSLWSEIQPSVTVRKGLFSVLLGSINPIPDTVFNGPTRWLGIRVPPDAEMTPREPIVSVGYAFKSHEAEVADSSFHADTAEYAISTTPDNDWVISGDTLIYREQGNVGIGTAEPGAALEIAKDIAYYGTAIRVVNTNPNANNGHAFEIIHDGQPRIRMYPDNMVLLDENGAYSVILTSTYYQYLRPDVGIGTTEPDEELHVVGNIKMVDGNQASGKVLTSDASGVGTWQASPGGISGIYDSGWFAVSTGNLYTKTHNLGTTKVLAQVWFSDQSDGSSNVFEPSSYDYQFRGLQMRDLTTAQISIVLRPNIRKMNADGSYTNYSSGYARIIMSALE